MMKPTGKRLLVQSCEPTKSAGGLHMVRGTADALDKDRAQRCEVKAIGPGERWIMKDGKVVHVTCAEIMGEPVAVGDIVYCRRFVGVHRVPRADGTEDVLQLVLADNVLGVERP